MEYESVIISGTPGSGKSTLVREIASDIGWDVLSLGDFWKERWRKDFPDGEMPFHEYWSNSDRKVNIEINERARERIRIGGVICDSRFSPVYSENLPSLNVFVEAPLNVRAARNVGRGIYAKNNYEETEEIIKRRFEDERRMCKELFGADFADEKFYHLFLDTSKLTIKEEIRILIWALSGLDGLVKEEGVRINFSKQNGQSPIS